MAGLPWIEVDTDLPRHPKAVRLAFEVGNDMAWAYMVQLWMWCAEQLPSGRLSGDHAAAVLEHAAGWVGEAGAFVAAAVKAGFLDRDGEVIVVHGWQERAAAHLAKRERDAERQAKRRERVGQRFRKQPVTRDVRVTSAGGPRESHGDRNPNPNPNQKQIPSGSIAPPLAPPEPKTEKPPTEWQRVVTAWFEHWEGAHPEQKCTPTEDQFRNLRAKHKALGTEQLITRMARAFEAEWWLKGGADLGSFVKHVDKFAQARAPPPRSGVRPEFRSKNETELEYEFLMAHLTGDEKALYFDERASVVKAGGDVEAGMRALSERWREVATANAERVERRAS